MIVRGLLQFWQKKLPKWSFRGRLPTILTEEASKMIISCEASYNFDRRSFQNDRFVRGSFQISQTKLPKRAFRARLPTILTRSDEKVARDMCKLRISPQFWASDDHKVTRGLRPRALKFAFHHSFGRPTSTKWREGCLPPVSTKPTRRKKKKKF